MTYSFVVMAILVWQNMNMVVVEDSYLSVKYTSGKDWLNREEKESPQGEDDHSKPPALA